MTKTFLAMDKNRNGEHPEGQSFARRSFPCRERKSLLLAHNANISQSPMHTLPSNVSSYDEEAHLERDIDYLERRLATAKSHLVMVTSQKCKQLKA